MQRLLPASAEISHGFKSRLSNPQTAAVRGTLCVRSFLITETDFYMMPAESLSQLSVVGKENPWRQYASCV